MFEKIEPKFSLQNLSPGTYSADVNIVFSNRPNNNGTITGTAQVYNVPSGNINVPSDIPYIQTALELASEGHTITVATGTYFEDLYLSYGKQNVIKSESGPNQTILDGSQSWKDRFIDINSGNFCTRWIHRSGHTGTYAIRGYDAPGSTYKNLILKNNREYMFQDLP